MRRFPCLEGEQKSCAIWYIIIRQSPNHLFFGFIRVLLLVKQIMRETQCLTYPRIIN
jgi:hypothetical protein